MNKQLQRQHSASLHIADRLMQKVSMTQFNSLSFPMKLHKMLEEASKSDLENVVSWQPGGKSFKVLQPQRFAAGIMHNYFNQTKYKSFQRQLNIYGFRVVQLGPNKGGYAHRFFAKDEPELTDLITRRKATHSHIDPKMDSDLTESQIALGEDFSPIALGKYPTASYGDSVTYNGSGNQNFYDIFFNEDTTETFVVDATFSSDKTQDKASESKENTPVVPVVSESEGEEELELFSLFSDYESNDPSQTERIFPWKLHTMLEDAQRDGFQHIVSWVEDGTAFRVHDSKEFVAKVMPNYFYQTRYESFRRQLNLYGFTRVVKGPNRGIISHSHLVKSDRSLCKMFQRKPKVAGAGQRNDTR